MVFWYYFWIGNFLVAGSAFTLITVIVLIRGIGELRVMFSRLRASQAGKDCV